MRDVLIDNYEIARLLSRYNSTVDTFDFDGWAECFVDGGVFDGAYQRFVIPEELDKFRAMALQIMEEAPNIRHFTTNLQIDIDDDAAKATSFLMLVSTPKCCEDGTVPNSRIVQAGVYYDDLVRVDGQWKIKLRRAAIDGAPDQEKPSWTAEA